LSPACGKSPAISPCKRNGAPPRPTTLASLDEVIALLKRADETLESEMIDDDHLWAKLVRIALVRKLLVRS
jgi:hypothetical protein